MAGIGFVLRRLARDEALSTNLRGYAHAALVSAGPWLFTVLALVGVELFARGLVPREQLQRFSVVKRPKYTRWCPPAARSASATRPLRSSPRTGT